MTEAAYRPHNVPAARGVLILGNRISDRRTNYGEANLDVIEPRGADGVSAAGAGCAQRPAGAAAAMGVTNMKSIQYTGTGWQGMVGQNVTPDQDWPRVDLTSYTRTIDFDTMSSQRGVRPRAGQQSAARRRRRVSIPDRSGSSTSSAATTRGR